MTHQEIKELARHRAVPPWVMKLVGDAIAIEREACAKVCDDIGMFHEISQASVLCFDLGKEIRARK